MEIVLSDEAVAEPPPDMTLDELAAVAVGHISPKGEVTCPVSVWADVGAIGNISDWPSTQPPEKRSVSARCRLHPNCVVAKSRKKFSDLLLCKWLLSGKIPPPGATAAQKRELAEEHKLNIALYVEG